MPPKEGKHALWFCLTIRIHSLHKTFPYTKLLCPLKAGKEYTLRLWVNTNKHKFSHLDVACTSKDPSRENSSNIMVEPTFQFDNSNIVQTDKTGWMQLSKQFIPNEDYNFLLLGNLLNNTEQSKLKKGNTERSGNIIFIWMTLVCRQPDSSLNKCPQYDETTKQLYAEIQTPYQLCVYLDERKCSHGLKTQRLGYKIRYIEDIPGVHVCVLHYNSGVLIPADGFT